jgi:hypothetical protein
MFPILKQNFFRTRSRQRPAQLHGRIEHCYLDFLWLQCLLWIFLVCGWIINDILLPPLSTIIIQIVLHAWIQPQWHSEGVQTTHRSHCAHWRCARQRRLLACKQEGKPIRPEVWCQQYVFLLHTGAISIATKWKLISGFFLMPLICGFVTLLPGMCA